MGRPQLELGTAGRVRATQLPTGGWVARCRYRDFDGVTRLVEKRGKTRGGAEQALAKALRDRSRGDADSAITPDTRVSAVARAWLAELVEKDLSPSTVQLYRDRLDKQVLPALGSLKVRELTVGIVDRHLTVIKAKHSASIAKTCKSVLSGLCGLATRHDALPMNPVRDTARISTKPKKAPTSLTVEQIHQLRAYLSYDFAATYKGLDDLVAFMLATGMRIGEVCALSWSDVDLDAATVTVRGTVLRVKGVGLIVSRPKSKAGERSLELPSWCVEMLRARKASSVSSLLFTTELGNMRDPSNTRRDLREAFRRIGYGGLTSHVFRKSVATLMDDSGLPARAAADQLGHSKVSQTQDTYYGRKVRKTGAAEVLEALDVTSR